MLLLAVAGCGDAPQREVNDQHQVVWIDPIIQGDTSGGLWAISFPMYTPRVLPIIVRQANPLPSLSTGNDSEWREIVARYFPPQEVEKALRVSWCESHWHDEYDASGNHVGKFQIAWKWHRKRFGHPDELLDPETNARVASEIWRDNNGWSPWPICGQV